MKCGGKYGVSALLVSYLVTRSLSVCVMTMTLSVTLVNVGEGRAAVFNKVLAFITAFSSVAIAASALAGSRSLTLLNSLFSPGGLHMRASAAAFHLVTSLSRRFDMWIKCNSVVYFAFGMFTILERMASHISHASISSERPSAFREAMKFAKDYRALAVLQAHYTALFSHYIALIQTGFVFAITSTASRTQISAWEPIGNTIPK